MHPPLGFTWAITVLTVVTGDDLQSSPPLLCCNFTQPSTPSYQFPLSRKSPSLISRWRTRRKFSVWELEDLPTRKYWIDHIPFKLLPNLNLKKRLQDHSFVLSCIVTLKFVHFGYFPDLTGQKL